MVSVATSWIPPEDQPERVVPKGNHEPSAIFDYLTRDFETAWNALAALPNESGHGRGNFMFGGMSMVLLELACRTAAADVSGDTLRRFAAVLREIEPFYFFELAKPRLWSFYGATGRPSAMAASWTAGCSRSRS